jgi:alkanesulfonate monooxygenase SsuD/methylene tetrahydromethanopterin reductase-like flavin-dependent oxidoreductase (luciferase family)
MLEELLQVTLQMWHGDERPFEGKHYQMARPLNYPGPVQRPHPPILIAGGGEKKTLRLVAQHADACQLPAYDVTVGGADLGGDLRRKLDVLRQHCVAVGRDYAEITKTAGLGFDLGDDQAAGRREFLATLHQLASLGFSHAILAGRGPWSADRLAALAELLPDIHAIEWAG